MTNTAQTDLGLVFAAGGCGTRFHGARNKLLEPLGDALLFAHCLRTLLPAVSAGHAVLVVSASVEEKFLPELQRLGLAEQVRLVHGGASRAESVLLGLQALPASVIYAAVQDAARPFTSLKLLMDCLQSARERGSGVAARPVTDTIKMVEEGGQIRETPPRATLWAAETPQVFPLSVLVPAYRHVLRRELSVTDDAQAVEVGGGLAHIVPARLPNPKVTYGADLADVRRLLEDG
ncbi:MAG: 2-C-methyl-D-erythritol 4-phosphate cytidylyltransferase [Lentisphaeria bacterium]|nr:2-C-methyl-D-erythritol 4-phosphate cytidylyltransferase [Lentisphaeria bacterium]